MVKICYNERAAVLFKRTIIMKPNSLENFIANVNNILSPKIYRNKKMLGNARSNFTVNQNIYGSRKTHTKLLTSLANVAYSELATDLLLSIWEIL